MGDILKLQKNQRLPADVVILKSIPNDFSVESHGIEQITSKRGSQQAATTIERAVQNGPDPVRETQITGHEQSSGETFIRTDQLDGETDWKLRLPSPSPKI